MIYTKFNLKYYRVEEQHSVDLIIKSLPSNIGRRKSFRSTDFFRNEIAFYEHVSLIYN